MTTKPPAKILCLHGAGSNARIFAAQTARLAHALRPHNLSLHYPDAPHECPAGPNILPFFEGEEPFRRWHSPAANDLAHLREVLLREIATHGPFAGVLGFSEGARTAVELLRYEAEAGGEIGFGVVVCAAKGAGAVGDSVGNGRGGKVRVPVVVVVGEKDEWGVGGEEAVGEWCEDARVWRFGGGHHMPATTGENEELVGLILGVWGEARERKARGV